MAQQGNRRSPASLEAGRDTPAVPDKLYFRIGEVATLCGVATHVLRFWESEFPQLKPNKGGTGQRLYRRRDVLIALRIKSLLYEGGFTIPGARQKLTIEQRGCEPQLSLAIVDTSSAPTTDRRILRHLQREMREVLDILSAPPQACSRTARLTRMPRGKPTPKVSSPDLFT